MTAYVVLSASGEPYTLGGRVLVHGDKAELEFLIPDRHVIPLPHSLKNHPFTRWRDHPGMGAVRWPLRRSDFR